MGECKLISQWDITTDLSGGNIVTMPNACEDMEKLDLLYLASRNIKLYGHSRKQFGSFLKIKYATTVWPNNCTSGIYPRKMKSYVHTEICTWMFRAAFFLIAPNWEQSKGEWINTLWYIHTMRYYSEVKRNELLKHRGKTSCHWIWQWFLRCDTTA